MGSSEVSLLQKRNPRWQPLLPAEVTPRTQAATLPENQRMADDTGKPKCDLIRSTSFTFHTFSYPQSMAVRKHEMENSRNKQPLGFTFRAALSNAMTSYTGHPAARAVTHPFGRRLHATVTSDSSVIRATVPDHSACARVTLISPHNGPEAIHMLSLQGGLIMSLFYSRLLLISYCAWFVNQTPSQVCTCGKAHSIYRVWCYPRFQASAGGLGMSPLWIGG